MVKRTGDGAIVEFRSVIDAVRCALEVQDTMVERNAGVPFERRIEFRVGIHLGDIVEESDGDLMGDGVNIAARLESICDVGGICRSEDVYWQVRDKVKEQFIDLGEQALRNIARPVHAYQVVSGPSATKPVSADPGKPAMVLALPDKPSIAVLTFQNMSGDVEQEYFADGIAEDIITALSKLRGFFVIARNSTFAYKGKNADLRQVARDLGVRYVLEGSVRGAGDRLRVTAQLIDASTAAHVWAERYDRSLTDLFAVQDKITESVVASIEPQVYAAENVRARGRQTESLDAQGCVIRAMPYVWTWVAEDNKTAVALLERALELDPSYARASSLLVWAYGARAQLGWSEPSEMLDEALAKARQAIEQDWDDPWAHMAAGYVHMVSRRFKNAVEELTEAIDRNPNFAFAHMLLSSTYAYGGMIDDGLRHVSISMRLSKRATTKQPISRSPAYATLLAKRFSEAVVFERRAVQLWPHFTTARRTLAAAAGLAGELDVAAEALAAAKRLQLNMSLDWIEKYHPIVHTEDRALYIEGLRRAGLT